MSKNLVFIGNYGNRNVGDDAILQVLSGRYAKKYPGYKQFVFSRFYVEDIERITRAKGLSLSFKNVLWVLLNAQLIIIGGGGIFSAYTGPVAKLIPVFGMVSKLLGKRVIYESIGFYQTAGSLEKMLVLASMLLADEVSVRDQASLKTVFPIAGLKRVQLVDDPGLQIQPVGVAQAHQILKREGIVLQAKRKLIMISAKRLKDKNMNAHFTTVMQQLVRALAKTNKYSIVFVPFCQDKEKYWEQDGEYALEIMDGLGAHEQIFRVTGYYRPDEVAGIVALSDVFIATRFHAIIFGHAVKAQLVPISYEEKCADFMLKQGYPLLTAGEVSLAQLQAAIKKVTRS